MHKLAAGLLGAAALAIASAAQAAVITIDLGNPSGNLGTDHTYTTGAGNVVASGYTASNVDGDLFGKALGGNEQGLGLAADPSHQNEIYSPSNGGTNAFVQLDVSGLFGSVSAVDFFMNSSTSNEQWAVYGSNTDAAGLGTLLLNGTDEGSANTHTLPDFGQFQFYNFYSLGTNGTSFGNVLIGGLTLTESVPEPATWAMMLIGFGAVGWQLRRRRPQLLAQAA
jgi:PEP-CTERM motif-containing protein